jgi:hypothetical protein
MITTHESLETHYVQDSLRDIRLMSSDPSQHRSTLSLDSSTICSWESFQRCETYYYFLVTWGGHTGPTELPARLHWHQ